MARGPGDLRLASPRPRLSAVARWCTDQVTPASRRGTGSARTGEARLAARHQPLSICFPSAPRGLFSGTESPFQTPGNGSRNTFHVCVVRRQVQDPAVVLGRGPVAVSACSGGCQAISGVRQQRPGRIAGPRAADLRVDLGCRPPRPTQIAKTRSPRPTQIAQTHIDPDAVDIPPNISQSAGAGALHGSGRRRARTHESTRSSTGARASTQKRRCSCACAKAYEAAGHAADGGSPGAAARNRSPLHRRRRQRLPVSNIMRSRVTTRDVERSGQAQISTRTNQMHHASTVA